MEIVKTAIRVGNSAGVLLPKKWLNTKVRVILEPLDLEKEILEILAEKGILKKILGIYVVGSHARNEQTSESDIDILVLTTDLNEKITRGRYDIMCISQKEVQRQLKENALPLLAMVREAKTILNENLLKEYKKTPLTLKNSEWHIETTKSAMDVVKEYIKLAEETGERISDSAAYSLILRLRTLYIINCIRKNKQLSTREFLKSIKEISGSLDAYDRYLNVKKKGVLNYKLKIEEAIKLRNYINREIEAIEKWLKEKKD